MKNNTILIGIVVLAIGLGAGFFGGMQYQSGKQPAGNQQFGGMMRNGAGQGGTRRTGGQNVGEIISADASSITIKLQDGSTKIVLLAGTTSINQATQAAVGDLKTGQRVAVFGTANSDGSITAQNISINPIMRNPSGAPAPTGNTSR